MKKNLSKKERQQKSFYNKLIIIAMCVVVLLIVGIVVDSNSPKPTYTAEQMAHDHNGDGIPDH